MANYLLNKSYNGATKPVDGPADYLGFNKSLVDKPSDSDIFNSKVATGLAAGMALLSGVEQASVLEEQGNYAETISKINAEAADRQAADAERRGVKEANQLNQKVRGMVGTQRAAYAGQNVQVDSGTASQVQLDTMNAGIEDATTIRNNAIREALGYRLSGSDQRNRGAMSSLAAKSAATNTILTGGVQAASIYSKK